MNVDSPDFVFLYADDIVETFLLATAKPQSCQALFSDGNTASGEYTIWIDGVTPTKVFCNMDVDGGGWTVIQRRVDGSTNFYRGWTEYKQGFGTLSRNSWLGLDAIHNLTKNGAVLRIDMTDINGIKLVAKYGIFKIGNESTNYRLNISRCSGNASDPMSYHNGMNFSTYDRHPDAYNCALSYKAAWWFNSCYLVILNGQYSTVPILSSAMHWYRSTTWISSNLHTIIYSEMKVRGK